MSTAEEMESLRDEVERLDREVVGLLARRVEVARQIGAVKREAGLPTLDPEREAAVVRRAGELARETGLDPEEIRAVWWHVVGLSRRAQMEE